MARPKIQLEVISDFIISAGKIDDKALIKKLRQSIDAIEIPEIDISALVDLKNPQRVSSALKSIAQGIDSIGKSAKSIPNIVEELASSPDLSEEQRERLFGSDLEKGQDRLENELRARLNSLQKTLANAARVTQQLPIGMEASEVRESMQLLDDLVSKRSELADLGPREQRLAAQALQLTREQANLLKQVQQESIKLGRPVIIPAKTIDGEERGARKIPGIPVSLPGLEAASKDLQKLAKDAEEALQPVDFDALIERVNELKERVKNQLNPALTQTRNLLKSAALPDDVRLELEAQVKAAEDSVKATRKLRDQLSKADRFDVRDEKARELTRRLEEDEKRLLKVRSAIEDQVARQRELELGRYIKRAGELSRSVVAQQQREIGATLLKGETPEKVTIEGLTQPAEASNVVEALRGQVRDAAQELVKYTEKAKGASLATDSTFLQLQEKLEKQQALLTQARRRQVDIVKETGPVGERRVQVLDVQTESATRKIAELTQKLDDLRRSSGVSTLSGEDRERFVAELSNRVRQADQLRQALESSRVEPNLAERTNQLSRYRAEVANLMRDINRLGKSLSQEDKLSDQAVKLTRGFSTASTQARNLAKAIENVGKQFPDTDLDSIRQRTGVLQDSFNSARESMDRMFAEGAEDPRLLESAVTTVRRQLEKLKAETAALKDELTSTQVSGERRRRVQVLDVKTDTANLKVAELAEKLGDLGRAVTVSTLSDQDRDRFLSELADRARQVDEVRRALEASRVEPNLEQRTAQLSRYRSEVGNLMRDIGRLSKGLSEEDKISDQAVKLTRQFSTASTQALNLAKALEKLSKESPDTELGDLKERTEALQGSFDSARLSMERMFEEGASDPKYLESAVTAVRRQLEKLKTETAALKEELTASQISDDRQRREQAEESTKAVVDRGFKQIEEEARRAGIEAPEGRRPSSAAIGAAVGAITISDTIKQRELEAALTERIKAVEADLARQRSQAYTDGTRASRERSESLEREYNQLLKHKETLNAIELQRRKARKEEVSRDLFGEPDLSESEKQKPFVNVLEAQKIKKLLDGLEEARRGITQRRLDIRNQLREMTDLGGPAVKATDDYRELNDEMLKLGKNQKEVIKLTRKLTEELKNIEASTTPEELAKIEIGQEIISEEVISAAGGIEGLSRTTHTLSPEQVGQLPVVRKQLEKQLRKTQRELARMAAEGVSRHEQAYRNAAREAVVLEQAIARVNTRIRGHMTLTSQLGALARQFARYGLGYAALYQVTAGFTNLVSSVVSLDDALISIKAVTQSTDKQMGSIEGSIKRVALATQFTTDEIATAAQTLAQAGVEADNFPDALSSVAAFASATQSSIEVSADLISSLRNVFKDMEDLQIANQLTQAVNISKLNAEDLKTIISLSAQVASTYNLTSEQYLSAVTTLRNAGIKASTVATGLRQALIEVFSPDAKTIKVLRKRFQELGEDVTPEQIRQRFFSFSQQEDPGEAVLRELRRLGFGGAASSTFSGRTFDVRAENAINAWINNLDEYVQSQAQLVFGNAAVTSSQTQMESLSNSLKNLGAALTTTGHDISRDLLPVVEDLIDKMTDAVEGLSEFDSQLRLKGSSFGDILFSSLISAGLAYPATRGQGFTRGAAVVAGSAVVGGAAGVYGREVAADYGANEVEQRIAGDVAAAASTLMLVYFKEILGAIKRGFVRLIPRSVTNLLAAMAIAAAGIASSVSSLGPVSRIIGAMGRLRALFAATGPIGLILTIAASAGSLIMLAKRYTRDIESLRTQVEEAARREQSAIAERDEIRSQTIQYKPSNPEENYVAPNSVFAGRSERLIEDFDDFSRRLSELFDVSGDLTEEATQGVVQALDNIEKYGAEAGPQRDEFVDQLQKLKEVQDDFGNDPETREQLNNIVTLYSDIKNKSKGVFKELARVYKEAAEIDPTEELSVDEEFSLVVRESIQRQGLTQEALGIKEPTSNAINELLNSILSSVSSSQGILGKEAEAVRKVAQEGRTRLIKQLEQNFAEFKSYQDTFNYALENIRSPQNKEDLEAIESDIQLLRSREEKLRPKITEPVAVSRPVQMGTYGIGLPIQNIERRERVTSDLPYKAFADALERIVDTFIDNLKAREIAEEVRLSGTINKFRVLQERADEGNEVAKRGLETLRERAAQEKPPREAEALFTLNIPTAESLRTRQAPTELTRDAVSVVDQQVVIANERGIASLDTYADQLLEASAALEKFKEELTFEETQEAQDNRFNIYKFNQEVREARSRKRFPEASEALDRRREAELKDIEDRRNYLERRGPDDTPTGELKHRKKLNQLLEERYRIESQYNEERRSIGEQRISFEQSQLKEQLKNLEKIAEEAASDPFFKGPQELEGAAAEYRRTVQEFIENLRELGKRYGTQEEAAIAIDAAMAEFGDGLITNAGVLDKMRSSMERYLNALPDFFDAFLNQEGLSVEESIRRQDRGISPSREDRLKANRSTFGVLSENVLPVLMEQEANIKDQYDNLGEGATAGQRLELLNQLSQVRQQIQRVREELAQLEEERRSMLGDVQGEVSQGMDPQGIFSDLEAKAEENVSNISENIREAFVSAFDGVSDIIVDSAFGDLEGSFAENLDNIVSSIFKDLAKQILKGAIEASIVRVLGGVGSLFGGSSAKAASGGVVSGGGVDSSRTGSVIVNGTALPPAAFASGGVVGGGPVREGLMKLMGGDDESQVDAVKRNYVSENKRQETLLREAIINASAQKFMMGGVINPLRRGRGGALDRVSLGQAIRRTHGGMIRGPGTGTSDSIPGVIVDSRGVPQRGILVSNGESILNKEITSKLGKPTIDFLNQNADKFAMGGVINNVRNIQQTAASVASGSSRRFTKESEPVRLDGVASALSSLSDTMSQPTSLNLEVSDSALNVTLRDYVENYLADVVARR